MDEFVQKSSCGKSFMVVDPRSVGFEDDLQEFDRVEPPRAVWSRIARGDFVVDIGAGWGQYSLPALAMGAQVRSFEPSPTKWECLGRSIRINGYREYELLECGIYDGTSYPSDLASELFSKPPVFRTLDHFAYSMCDWIRISCAGTEVAALVGAINTVRKFRPQMVISTHESDVPALLRLQDTYNSRARLHQILDELGYVKHILTEGRKSWVIAWHPNNKRG